MSKSIFNVPAFPTDIFSGDVRNFVREASRSLSCPEDFIGVVVLTVLSSAIGSSRVIQVKEDWTEPAVLYTGIIAHPSSKKSPAFNIALKPVMEQQQKMKEIYDLLKESYEESYSEWESDKQSFDKPRKPKMKRNYINDFTMEALSKILLYNQKGLLLGLDEIVGWVSSMDAYRKKGGDKEKWLSMWTCSPIVADRSSMDEPIIIPRPFVSVTGGIQPDRIQRLQSKEHDGFLARVLLSFPEPIKDKWVDEPIPKEVMHNYHSRYEKLYDLQPNSSDGNKLKPVVLKFTPQAKKCYIHFHGVNIDDIEHEHSQYLKAAFKKIEAYTARFALILQLASYPESTVVDKEAVEHAVILAEYFKAHTRKVYAHLHNVKLDNRVLRAVEFIRSNGGKVTIREFYNNKVAGCKNKKDSLFLLEELENKGIGRIDKKQASSGGRPTITFILHNYDFGN